LRSESPLEAVGEAGDAGGGPEDDTMAEGSTGAMVDGTEVGPGND